MANELVDIARSEAEAASARAIGTDHFVIACFVTDADLAGRLEEFWGINVGALREVFAAARRAANQDPPARSGPLLLESGVMALVRRMELARGGDGSGTDPNVGGEAATPAEMLVSLLRGSDVRLVLEDAGFDVGKFLDELAEP